MNDYQEILQVVRDDLACYAVAMWPAFELAATQSFPKGLGRARDAIGAECENPHSPAPGADARWMIVGGRPTEKTGVGLFDVSGAARLSLSAHRRTQGTSTIHDARNKGRGPCC
jgi:hypothetical protein